MKRKTSLTMKPYTTSCMYCQIHIFDEKKGENNTNEKHIIIYQYYIHLQRHSRQHDSASQ